MKAILSKIGEPLVRHLSLIGKRPRIHYAILNLNQARIFPPDRKLFAKFLVAAGDI